MSKSISTALSNVEVIAELSARMSFELTKSDEVALFQAFVSVVPENTYLADYLNGAVEHFKDMSLGDLCFPMMDRILALYREKVEAEAQLKAALERVKVAEEKARAIESANNRSLQQLDQIKDLATNIESMIRRAGK